MKKPIKEILVAVAILLNVAVLIAAVPATRQYAKVNYPDFLAAVSNGLISVSNMFTKVNQDSLETLHFSTDTNWFLIKADDTNAIAYLQGKATTGNVEYVMYDHQQMLEILQGTNWIPASGGPTNQ